MKTLHALALPLLLAAGTSACDPAWNRGAAVRRTLDAQVQAGAPPEVREEAAKARLALSKWQNDHALRLDVAVDESEEELTRAFSIAGRSDLHCGQSLQLFSSATDLITRSPTPLDSDAVESVAFLLDRSRELAREARERSPSATSPHNALKTLRRHQSDPSHYAY